MLELTIEHTAWSGGPLLVTAHNIAFEEQLGLLRLRPARKAANDCERQQNSGQGYFHGDPHLLRRAGIIPALPALLQDAPDYATCRQSPRSRKSQAPATAPSA